MPLQRLLVEDSTGGVYSLWFLVKPTCQGGLLLEPLEVCCERN